MLHWTQLSPRAETTFPCAPIYATRRPIIELRRGAALPGVCCGRQAERCQRSGSQFEARIPGSTLSPLPWHHPCPPVLHAQLCQTQQLAIAPPHHGGAEPAPPHGATSGAAQHGAMCAQHTLESMPIWFSSRGAREVTTSKSAPAHQQGHSVSMWECSDTALRPLIVSFLLSFLGFYILWTRAQCHVDTCGL